MSVRPSKAMVLAAGFGVRMRPLTDRMPKPLVRVAGRALLDHVLDKLADAGADEAVVNVHYLPDQIINHVAKRTGPASSSPMSATRCSAPAAASSGPCRCSGPRRFFTSTPTPFGSTACDRIWRVWPKHSNQRAWIYLLLMAPTTTSIGYGGRGDYAMLADGALRKRREHQVVPFVYAGAAIMSPSLFAARRPANFRSPKYSIGQRAGAAVRAAAGRHVDACGNPGRGRRGGRGISRQRRLTNVAFSRQLEIAPAILPMP